MEVSPLEHMNPMTTPRETKRRVLRAIRDLQGDDEAATIADTRVANQIGLELQVVRDYMELLAEEGKIIDASDNTGHAAALTARGRISLRKADQRSPRDKGKMRPEEVRRFILQTIQDNQPSPGSNVQDSVLAEKIGLPVQDVRDHLDLLEEEDNVQLAKTTGGYGAWLTARGRLGLKEPLGPRPAKDIAVLAPEAISRLVLETINEGQGRNVQDSEIAETTGLSLEVVRDHLDLLDDEDVLVLAKDLGGNRSARLNARGRLALSGSPAPILETTMHPKRIFLTHGRSPDWHEIQRYIEKTVGVETLELSEEPFQGRTILQKLDDESRKCGYAVIVLTGDDRVGEDEVRARENVIHEIGFFQGRYGLDRVCLVYERGVNIPSNISGLGYIPFPKGEVRAAFADLRKEIDAAFSDRK
jgi:predicted transcriptional regulator